jgi:hypothetical protein
MYAYIKHADQSLEFVEIIPIGITPGVPPRPTPGPTPPGGGGGGPVDPGYSPPWAQVPVDPGYSPPWAQIPVDPGYSPPWATPGPGGGQPPSPGPGFSARVFLVPPTDPPATPPEGMAPDSKQVMIWFGPGTKPAMAWVAPYASTGPVEPGAGA